VKFISSHFEDATGDCRFESTVPTACAERDCALVLEVPSKPCAFAVPKFQYGRSFPMANHRQSGHARAPVWTRVGRDLVLIGVYFALVFVAIGLVRREVLSHQPFIPDAAETGGRGRSAFDNFSRSWLLRADFIWWRCQVGPGMVHDVPQAGEPAGRFSWSFGHHSAVHDELDTVVRIGFVAESVAEAPPVFFDGPAAPDSEPAVMNWKLVPDLGGRSGRCDLKVPA